MSDASPHLFFQTKDIDGITFTGGEPFMQAKNLYYLAKEIKKHKLSILSYSGYTMEEILKSKNKSKKKAKYE